MAKSTYKAPKHKAEPTSRIWPPRGRPAKRRGARVRRVGLDFYLDGDLVANATSPGGDLGCPGGDGPVLVDTIQASPIAISGKHELRLEFTTADEFYHNESFYELTFYYICE